MLVCIIDIIPLLAFPCGSKHFCGVSKLSTHKKERVFFAKKIKTQKRDRFFCQKEIKTPVEPCTILLQLSPSQGALRPLHLCNFGHWRIVVDEWYTALCEVSLKLNLHVQVKEFVHIHRHCNVNLAAAFAAELSN